MIQKLLALFVLSPLLILGGDYMSKEDAESFVENGIYKRIKKTVNVDKEQRLGSEDFIDMYGRDNNNLPLYRANFNYANDIYILNGGKGGVKAGTPDYNIRQIVDFVKQHNGNVSFEFSICGSGFTGPKLQKNEREQQFADVYVRKEWTVDGITTVIFDTVTVNLRNRSVPIIRNGIMSLNDISEETLEGMMAKAAGWYDCACRLDKWWSFSKRKEAKSYYNKAFVLYEKVLKEDQYNGDAWYNLGVMYFKNQGVGNLSRKQRLQKAYDCWKKSNLKKACRAISYITDGREGC